MKFRTIVMLIMTLGNVTIADDHKILRKLCEKENLTAEQAEGRIGWVLKCFSHDEKFNKNFRDYSAKLQEMITISYNIGLYPLVTTTNSADPNMPELGAPTDVSAACDLKWNKIYGFCGHIEDLGI